MKSGISKKMKDIIKPDKHGYITVFHQTDGLYVYRLLQGIVTATTVSNLYMFISEYQRNMFGPYSKVNFATLFTFGSLFLIFQARIGRKMIQRVRYHSKNKTIQLRSFSFFKGEMDREVESCYFKKKSTVRGGYFRFQSETGDSIYINFDENIHGEATEVSSLITNILLGEKSIIDQSDTGSKVK